MAQIVQINESSTIDQKTGEILDEQTEIHSFKTKKSGEYFKMFTEDIAIVQRTTHAGKKVLFEILSSEMKRNGEIAIGLFQKRAMAKRIGFAHTKSVDNGLKSLIENEVLVRIGRGTFKLSPFIFAKGTPTEIELDRIEYAKLTIIYNENGRDIKAEIKMKEEE